MTVKTNVTELPESRVRVEAEVPADEVERRIQQAARSLGSEMRVPGFRKGKVPPPVVIRRVGREAVLDEALRSSIGRWIYDALGATGLSTIGEPELDLGDLPAQGQPLSFSIEIGVRPPAKLGNYRGLEVGRREPEADPERIQAELDAMRDRFATLETVDRAAESGDHIVMDYRGTIDGEPFDGGEGRDQLLELGSGRLIPGFEDQLVGVSAGETRAVEVTFPDDYAEQLAGKAATFEVEVTEVKHKRLPELTDEFASDSAGFDSLEELKEDIVGRLRNADEVAVDREFENAVLDAAVAEASIDVPGPLVHARAHEMLEDLLHSLSHRGISKDTYLQITGKDEEELAHEAEPEALDALKREAVLAAVIEAEAIAPTDEELMEALRPAAERENLEPEKVIARLRKNDRLESARQDLARRQAIDLLVREAKAIPVEQAKAREKLWTPGKEPASAESGAAGGKLWTPGE